MLWVLVVVVVLSASGILYASLGPLRRTASARSLRVFAAIQFALAGVLTLARISGWA